MSHYLHLLWWNCWKWLASLIEDATVLSLPCTFTLVCSAQNCWCWNGQGSVSYNPTCLPPVNCLVRERGNFWHCYYMFFFSILPSVLYKKKSIWMEHFCNLVGFWTCGTWWSLTWSPDTITRRGMLKKSNISEEYFKKNKDGGQKP